jgi:hypothetical protein
MGSLPLLVCGAVAGPLYLAEHAPLTAMTPGARGRGPGPG